MQRFLAIVLVLAFVATARCENWPQFRGPLGTGIANEPKAPLKWSNQENVKWKAPLPDAGNSTPVVWNDRVFVTCAADKGTRRMLLCLDRANGQTLWTKEIAYTEKEVTHDTNPYCSSTPATDGERIVVWHGSAGVFCYDFQGRELWKQELGPFDHIWGNASSPILVGDLVILNCGPGVRCFLAAFDKRTGDEKWRVTPPDMVSKDANEYRGSWSTPVLVDEQGAKQLVVNLPERLAAFDPESGQELWFSKGLSKLQYSSPVVGPDFIVAMSGFHGPALGVKRGGKGDITDTHRLWLKSEKIPQRVGSGVLVGEHIYILQDGGQCWCLDPKTGERTWEQRLGGSWTSMCSAAGRLYVTDTGGLTYVLEPNPKECKVLAENRLGETTRASPAFSNGQIFVRTYKHLWCVEDDRVTW